MNQQQDLEKIAEGREAEIFAWQDGAVLRLLRSRNGQRQIEWEAQAMRAAAEAGVSVPAVQGATTVQERPGLIMERIDGADMLTMIGQRPWLLLGAARDFGEIHAQLHETAAPSDLPALKAKLKSRIESSDLVPKPLAEFAIARLEELPDGDRLCHGDFHPGNIIWREGRPVIIDWTNVTRGDPAADYARTDLMLRMGDPPPGSSRLLLALALVGRGVMVWAYHRAYQKTRPMDAALVSRWEAPVMANRLVEDIKPERAKLLKILEQRLGASG